MALRLLLVPFTFLFLEGLVFRTGLYMKYLEPDSTAGMLQSFLYNELHRTYSGKYEVLAVGDSRMGFRARIANQITSETGYTFASIAVPGSSPRCWYYMLREVDPHADRYSAIIIPTGDYDETRDEADRLLDLHYLVPILRLGDIVPFSASFVSWNHRWLAFRGSLLKGFFLKDDFQDFLVRHKARMVRLRWAWKDRGDTWYNAPWGSRTVVGLSVDWKARTIHYPDGLTPDQQREMHGILLPDAPYPSDGGVYLRTWLGRIVDRYRGTRTRILFIRLPRAPIPLPAAGGKRHGPIRDFAARGAALLLDEHAFDEIERPELFGDAMHMNGPGADRFSALLARRVRRALGAPGR